MNRRIVVGRGQLLIAAVSALGAVLALPGGARAAQDVVTTRETAVRSAPFDVAPEIVHAAPGIHFAAADQTQAGWRRVQLPDGRFGYLHDGDVIPTGNPANAVVPAPNPHAPPAAMPTQDAAAGSALAASAPAPASVPAATAAPAATVVAAAPALVVAPAQPSDTGAAPTFGPTLVGVMFSLLPVGTLSASRSGGTQKMDESVDALFAVAVAAFVDAPISPHLALGFSPQAVFRVNGGMPTPSSATEFDFRGRITGYLPLSQATTVFARLSPAFSFVSMPPGATADPAGFLVDVSVGTEVALLPNLFLIVDLGYQAGFQTHDNGNGATFDGTRYLHLGGGLAIGL